MRIHNTINHQRTTNNEITMAKNNLKIKFQYRDTVAGLEWQGHEYSRESVCDFLNAFAGMLEMNLEVRERKQEPIGDIDWSEKPNKEDENTLLNS